nr:RNA-directed DNA polymerase, eukaryota, reverse transcriptase zinc-binding domain protein [Tanacetum cinerariifolium]
MSSTDRIVWIDVEGIPLRAWSKTTFNKITRKWGELVFMDDSNSANKYSLRICVKTTFFHLIAESLKVIIKGKVYVVRAKEVTGWVPDFGEENSDESEDCSDNNSVGKKNWVESEEGEIILEFVQNDAFIDNIAKSEPINGDSRENQSGQHILKPSNHPSGDPFGLEDLIHHYENEKVEALREITNPSRFKKTWDRSLFDVNFPRRLNSDQVFDLEDMVSNEEIKRAVWDCGSDNLVIGDIVSQEQSAFIKGRQIMEGPLILNEIISWCKARKEQLLMFKLDFQKAFDSVRWDHLDDILGKLRFGIKWRG